MGGGPWDEPPLCRLFPSSGEWGLHRPRPSRALLTKDRRLIWGQRGQEAWELLGCIAFAASSAAPILGPFLGLTLLWGSEPPSSARSGVFSAYCPQGLPLPLLRGQVFKGSTGPRLSGPKFLSATPTPPPGPSPCSHFLIWVYHTGRKRRNFSLQAGLGGGVSPNSRGAEAPLRGTPATSSHAPSPSSQLPRLPAPPSRKGAQSLSGLRPGWEGAARKLRQAREALGKEGPRGKRRGGGKSRVRCETGCRAAGGSGASEKHQGAGQVERGRQDLLGFKVPMLRSGEQSSPGVEELGGQSLHYGVT